MSVLKAGSGNGGTGDGAAVSCRLVRRRLPGQRPCGMKGGGLGPGQGGVQVEGTVSAEKEEQTPKCTATDNPCARFQPMLNTRIPQSHRNRNRIVVPMGLERGDGELLFNEFPFEMVKSSGDRLW